MRDVIIYTDGSCHGNPGPGGYAAVVIDGGHKREISGGDWDTTNNRMELTAVIVGLQSLEAPSNVTIISDSQYVVRGISCMQDGTFRKMSHRASRKNADLWEKILRYSLVHKLSAMWVKAHAGNAMNHRCDALANMEASTLESEAPQRVQVFTALLLDRTCMDSEISNKYRIPLITVSKYRAQFFEHLRRHEKGDTGNGR